MLEELEVAAVLHPPLRTPIFGVDISLILYFF